MLYIIYPSFFNYYLFLINHLLIKKTITMKKITLLFLALTGMLNIANAQDITVFNFDGATPVFDSWSSTCVSVANPVPDGVNASANVGKYTHNSQWSEINVNLATPVDARFYTSFQFKVYSQAAGRLIVGCKNAANTSLSEYNTVQSVTAGWTTITQNIDARQPPQPIAKIYFSFKVDALPAGGSADVIYLDDLTFIKTTNAKLYSENFEADLAWDASPTFAPSTKIGKWKGGIDLQTAGDASITLEQWWAPHNRVLKFTSADVAVTIPNINVAGFTNLNLSIDCANANEATAPIIEASADGGVWVALTTVSGGALNAWGTQVISLPAATNTISIRINPAASNPVFFDNFVITATGSLGTESNQLTDNSIKVYPNPFVNEFKVDATNSEGPLQVSVFDVLGRKVEMAKSSSNQLLMGSSLNSGVYIVKVEGANAKDSKSFKIIKK